MGYSTKGVLINYSLRFLNPLKFYVLLILSLEKDFLAAIRGKNNRIKETPGKAEKEVIN